VEKKERIFEDKDNGEKTSLVERYFVWKLKVKSQGTGWQYNSLKIIFTGL
jgi:hypothetical protein